MAQKISETTTFVNFFTSRINGEVCAMFAESRWIKKQGCFVALSIRTFLLGIFLGVRLSGFFSKPYTAACIVVRYIYSGL
jgi:hypothetical protein